MAGLGIFGVGVSAYEGMTHSSTGIEQHRPDTAAASSESVPSKDIDAFLLGLGGLGCVLIYEARAYFIEDKTDALPPPLTSVRSRLDGSHERTPLTSNERIDFYTISRNESRDDPF